MRPKLSRGISVSSFNDFYWLKEELQSFCRDTGISASGSKGEISARIETLLLTGEITKPVRSRKGSRKTAEQIPLSLDTIIADNHRCSQNVRVFFKSVIPAFHFSTHIQDFLKDNPGKTYQDVVDAWHEEEEHKKDPAYRKEIAPQFEYNQFIRDFFADSANQGKGRDEAIEVWNNIKKRPGSNKYTPENQLSTL